MSTHTTAHKGVFRALPSATRQHHGRSNTTTAKAQRAPRKPGRRAGPAAMAVLFVSALSGAAAQPTDDASASPVEAAAVTVTFDNVETPQGVIRLSLCRRETYRAGDYGKCYKTVRVPASQSRAVIEGVAPGTYSISLHHDVDGNGELKTNFLGIPREPIGASNNAKARFGPPSFDDMAFEVKGEPVEMTITLYRV
jgi:uncharacterized protein (DUF2141 family)